MNPKMETKDKIMSNNNQKLISSEPSIFSLRKEDIDRIIIGSKGGWERPDIILKTMMFPSFRVEHEDCGWGWHRCFGNGQHGPDDSPQANNFL